MCYENIPLVGSRKKDSTVDSRCYELTGYERDAINQIKQDLKKGYKDPQILNEHLEYMKNLIGRLLGILEMERSVGAPTHSLELDIIDIRKLKEQLDNVKI